MLKKPFIIFIMNYIWFFALSKVVVRFHNLYASCQRPIRERHQRTSTTHRESPNSIHSTFLQHSLRSIQRGCWLRPWIPFQSSQGCPYYCFSWPLAQHPWLWCSYPACYAKGEKYQVYVPGICIHLSKRSICFAVKCFKWTYAPLAWAKCIYYCATEFFKKGGKITSLSVSRRFILMLFFFWKCILMLFIMGFIYHCQCVKYNKWRKRNLNLTRKLVVVVVK